MQCIIDVADRVIQQVEYARVDQFLAVCTQGGNIAGEGMVEAEQPESRLTHLGRGAGSVDMLETTEAVQHHCCAHRGGLSGRAVHRVPVVLLKDGIQVSAAAT